MKFLLLIWKKLAIIFIILFSIILVLKQKAIVEEVTLKAEEKTLSYQREIESLTAQLTVIKKYRRKIDDEFQLHKTETTSRIEALQSSLQSMQVENVKLKEILQQCKNKNNNLNSGENNEIERVPVDVQANTGELTDLRDKNYRQEKEIIELKTLVEELKKNETTLVKHSIDQGGAENVIRGNDEINPLLHPAEEHKGYADGENVHFHRQIPASADLEFKRGDLNNVRLPQILSPKDFVKKIDERQKLRVDGKLNGIKADGREEVVDYQSFKKPNKEENDYKEMGV